MKRNGQEATGSFTKRERVFVRELKDECWNLKSHAAILGQTAQSKGRKWRQKGRFGETEAGGKH